MQMNELRSKYRDAIIEIARAHRADNIRVFGSVARGEPNPRDIDLLVRFKPGASLLDEAGLDIALTQLLGEKVDVIGEDIVRAELRPFIFAEAVPL